MDKTSWNNDLAVAGFMLDSANDLIFNLWGIRLREGRYAYWDKVKALSLRLHECRKTHDGLCLFLLGLDLTKASRVATFKAERAAHFAELASVVEELHTIQAQSSMQVAA